MDTEVINAFNKLIDIIRFDLRISKKCSDSARQMLIEKKLDEFAKTYLEVNNQNT